jgi:hypothetical protein
MKESEVLEKKLENATPQEGTKKNLGWGKMEKMMAGKKMLLYHGLSFIVKYFSCNKINFTNNNNNNDDDDDSSLKFLKAGKNSAGEKSFVDSETKKNKKYYGQNRRLLF